MDIMEPKPTVYSAMEDFHREENGIEVAEGLRESLISILEMTCGDTTLTVMEAHKQLDQFLKNNTETLP